MVGTSTGRVRGGRDQFSWESIKTDKYRQNYLGHSLMAPVGKWQEGKDLIWYSKERAERKDDPVSEEQLKLQTELMAVRQREAELLGSTVNSVLSSANSIGRHQQISAKREEKPTTKATHDQIDSRDEKTHGTEKGRKRKREPESSDSKLYRSSSSQPSHSTHTRKKDPYDEGRHEYRSHSRHSHR
jgi:hypothetical protein